jgi:hypothetical protein
LPIFPDRQDNSFFSPFQSLALNIPTFIRIDSHLPKPVSPYEFSTENITSSPKFPTLLPKLKIDRLLHFWYHRKALNFLILIPENELDTIPKLQGSHPIHSDEQNLYNCNFKIFNSKQLLNRKFAPNYFGKLEKLSEKGPRPFLEAKRDWLRRLTFDWLLTEKAIKLVGKRSDKGTRKIYGDGQNYERERERW